MDSLLVKFFKAAMPSSPTVSEPDKLQEEALKRGYIVHPSVLNADVETFIKAETIDPNSTFYRTWEEVVSKDRFSLFLDQVAHYATTYGTHYNLEGNGYVPNEGAGAPDFREYTIIGPIKKEELYSRCLGLVTSGVALKSETVAAVCGFIVECFSAGTGTRLDIDSIKNREALSILASKLGIRPSDPVALLRFIIYESTGETMLIKSPELFHKIITSEKQFDFNQLSDSETDSLASIFLRFKPLFLAFRSHRTRFFDTVKKEMVMEATPSRPVINRIRRKAELLHKTVRPGFWETVLSEERPLEAVASRIGELSPFKTVSLLQTVRERMMFPDDGETKRMFVIRNGKAFTKPLVAGHYKGLKDYYLELEKLLEDRLLQVLRPKACTVRFPESVTLASPSSEKNFIGNYPFGSWYPLQGHNFFGIYWRNEWGTHDFDISFVYLGGMKVGWNSAYNTGHAVYSGDLTNADPEASEILYCKGTCDDGIIFCNRYNGEQGSRYRFFFGQEEIVELSRGYMVDPNNIVVNEDMTSVLRQSMLAAVCGGKIFLMDLGMGNSRVSSGMDAADKVAILSRKAGCFLDLKQILLKAGFTEAAHDETPALDLSDLRKDTLISLFSE